MSASTILGIPVTPAELTTLEQYRFPKTRKARVRRKWSKRLENYREAPDPMLYFDGAGITGHPLAIDRFHRSAELHIGDDGESVFG